MGSSQLDLMDYNLILNLETFKINILLYLYLYRIFGGLFEDIKRRLPHYTSDFTHALHIQCVASFVFMYFACITPVITFGGLLGEATHDYMVRR